MKRFLTIILLTFFCIGGAFVAAEVHRDTSEELAVCLVESFGWEIDESIDIDRFEEDRVSFYTSYYHMLGIDDLVNAKGRIGNGNLPGLQPELLMADFWTVMEKAGNAENVVQYRIPLQYDLQNEDYFLYASVAVYKGKLCETCIILGTKSPVSGPILWPLNVDRTTVDAWRDGYFKNRKPNEPFI